MPNMATEYHSIMIAYREKNISQLKVPHRLALKYLIYLAFSINYINQDSNQKFPLYIIYILLTYRRFKILLLFIIKKNRRRPCALLFVSERSSLKISLTNIFSLPLL